MPNLRSLEEVLKDIQNNQSKYEVWIELSNLYLQLKALKEALAAASRAVHLAPHTESVWLNRGSIYNKLGDPSSAEDDYTQAIIIFTVHSKKDLLYETLKKRALVRSIMADYQGAIDDLIIIKRNQKLDFSNKELLSYCKAALVKDI